LLVCQNFQARAFMEGVPLVLFGPWRDVALPFGLKRSYRPLLQYPLIYYYRTVRAKLYPPFQSWLPLSLVLAALARQIIFMTASILDWRMHRFSYGATELTIQKYRPPRLTLMHKFNFRFIGKFLEPIFNNNFLLFFLGVPSREKLVQARRFAPSTQIITSQHKGL